jgi:SAM-dependent methyltransferase
MLAKDDNYFDEAYFERGWERGTAYSNYSRHAENSAVFREIAEAIAFVFRPERALEIGCATGPIVRQLNKLGFETYGIDISHWAVENRLHENVTWASADALPFKDGEFDFVFSAHALEHLPRDIAKAVFCEMTRVSAKNAIQFHMLPMIGTHPYDYDPTGARQELKKDPTHNLLETRSWWLESFAEFGWCSPPIALNFRFDNEQAELSSAQFCLSSIKTLAPELMERAAEWNSLGHRQTLSALHSAQNANSRPTPFGDARGLFNSHVVGGNEPWSDLTHHFADPVDLTAGFLHFIMDVESDQPISLRVAVVSGSEEHLSVYEQWFTLPPGTSVFSANLENLSHGQGPADRRSVHTIHFGGALMGCTLRGCGRVEIGSTAMVLFE